MTLMVIKTLERVSKNYYYIIRGEKVGSVTYSIDGILLAEYPVYAAETIEKIDYGWCMEKVAERLFCHSSV